MRPLGTWGTGVYVALVVALAVGTLLGVYLYTQHPTPVPHVEPAIIVPAKSVWKHSVIGTSVEGRSIDAYTFVAPHTANKIPQTKETKDEPATGSRENSLAETAVISREGNRGLFREKPVAGETATQVVFVGGIHGGYEWNSVALAYEVLDYLTANPSLIPPGVQVTIIPNLNPDGVYKVTALEGKFSAADVSGKTEKEPGRFNAHGVDLNRNFGCAWQPSATWKGKKVSAGTAAFSEPEAQALQKFVEKELQTYAPENLSFIFWHSQANAVYASQCGHGVLPATQALMQTYATAAGYTAVATFDAYPVTGAAEDWLASLGVPAITVELSSHTSTDWDKNKHGVESVLHR